MSTPTSEALVPVEPTSPAPRRSRTPWVVVGVVLAVLLVAGGVIAALFLFAPRATGGPADAVLAYDTAYADADCDLYVSVTTVGYRERLAPTCADFEAEARAFADHFSEYEVVVQSTEVDGSTATVVTTETWLLDGAENSAEYTYTLVDDDGTWRIDALD